VTNIEDYLASETWYLQPDKINDNFGKIFDSVDVRIITSQNSQTDGGFTGKIKSVLFEVGGSFGKSKTESHEVNRNLAIQGMLRCILEKETEICDFNHALENGQSPSTKICFKGKARFCVDPKDDNNIIVNGLVGDRKFRCNCSVKYFEKLSSSRFKSILQAMDLIEDEYLDIFFVGTTVLDTKKILLLDASYIGGTNKDLTDLYKLK
jgi:hypothetical protein